MTLALVGVSGNAQQLPVAEAVKAFVRTSAPAIALTNVRVIDGTGASARDKQTVVIRDGMIADVGDSSRVTPPAGAEVIDLTGKSVIPGLVMVHDIRPSTAR